MMFKDYSMAGTGGAVLVLLQVVLPMLGLDLPEDTLVATGAAIMTILGTVLLVIGQLRRPDMKFGLIRK